MHNDTGPRVSRLITTPVKGLQLHYPRQIRLETFGVPNDRRFYLIDDSGRLVNGRRHGSLVQVAAEFDEIDDVLSLQFPDGSVVTERVMATDEKVSTNFFDHEVAGYVVQGPWAKSLSEFTGLDLKLVLAAQPGTGVDLMPATVLSDASIAFLRGIVQPDRATVDHRRFRMLIGLSGCAPHEEDTWQDALLAVGTARLRVGAPVPRCVVTRQDPVRGVGDVDTLGAINWYRGPAYDGADFPGRRIPAPPGIYFGRYCHVERAGVVTMGDPVRVERV